jgi:predicted esterase
VTSRWFPLLLALAAPAHAQGPWGVAYAPVDTRSPRPAVVFLHGMWAGPEDQCDTFVRGATPFGFLVCPRGNAPLAGPGDAGAWKMWKGTYADAERQIAAAVGAAEALAPGKLDRAGQGTIVGYSNGAYFAAEVAVAEAGRWPGVVLLSMKLDLDAARLKAAGVKRVLLAAGDQDGAHDSMQDLAAQLAARGVTARFMSLGPGGHEFPADMSRRMCVAIAWARAADDSHCAG